MQTMTMSQAPVAPWYRHRWPWLLMAGPAFVLVAGTITSYIAIRDQDALVVGDYYKKGKAINQDLRRDRAAAALGLKMELDYKASAGQLEGHISSNAPLADNQLMLHLAHATQPEKDVRVLVKLAPDGSFHVPLPMLERSRWTVLVEPMHLGWRLEGRWDWPASYAVSMQPVAD